jgi:uncharacterized protein YecT (DUF1311 family)
MGLVELMRRGRRPGKPVNSTVLARAAVLTALAALLAACSSSGSASSAATSASPGATGTRGTASASGAAASAAAASFVNIVEPFDPGHPARTEPAPASCGSQASTLAVERCYETKTENTDVTIDSFQLARYQSVSQAQRVTILAQDSTWLAARGPVCAVAFNTGGTIDGIDTAACLLDESTARLYAVRGVTAPEAMLKGTDSMDPDQLSWYTTPEGSRIAEINTQGDQTGGAIVAWVIVGGADGFVVNPKQFYYVDGSFTDPGLIEAPNPTYHRVATGVMYQFGVDYSRLRQDPNEVKGTGGYVYAPGSPVASWQ